MDFECRELISDLVLYLNNNEIPFGFCRKMAEKLVDSLKRQGVQIELELEDVKDNEQLLEALEEAFMCDEGRARYSSIMVEKSQGSEKVYPINEIAEVLEGHFKVYIKFDQNKLNIYESSTKFPSAGIKIKESHLIVQKGDIIGNRKFVLIFEDISANGLEIKSLYLKNFKNFDLTENKISIKEFPYTIGRKQVKGDTTISKECYIIRSVENNGCLIEIYQSNSSIELIKLFHNSNTIDCCDSPSAQSKEFWFSGAKYTLSLLK